MKNLVLALTVLLFVALLCSCKKDNDAAPLQYHPSSSNVDNLTFGHYYGMCFGEECVEIFKLENNKLFEDTLDQYPALKGFYTGKFIGLGYKKFTIAQDLESYFPMKLLNEKDTTLGCPDCADQGGLYIEYTSGKTHRFWRIDQSKSSVPAYLHPFMDKVNEKIALINQ